MQFSTKRISLHDPHGYMCSHENKFYRVVLKNYQRNYDNLVSTNLFKVLIDKGLLISHSEVSLQDLGLENDSSVYKVLLPQQLDFISYPQEWSFSMLQDAAITTLKVQSIALENGFVLKDASAYNIQFQEGKPIFIDTLSFEVYENGSAWQAYRQFCQHFLAPLYLMTYTDTQLNHLFGFMKDGIPLNLAAKLLPMKARLNMGALWHIFFHAQAEDNTTKASPKATLQDKKVKQNKNFNIAFLQQLTESLLATITKLTYKTKAHWSKYYQVNVASEYLANKIIATNNFLIQSKTQYLWDLGTNTGEFSTLAIEKGIKTVSFDYDHDSIEVFYNKLKENKNSIKLSKLALPLILNLAIPTPSSGWANTERKSWTERNLPDTLLALALIHHLRISDNIPLKEIAMLFSKIAPQLIIEFVPKEDEKVQILLQNKTDFYQDYTQENFEKIFKQHYTLTTSQRLLPSGRILYLFVNKRL
jgi:hypothetical protein